MKKSALVIVDMQNDFVPGGALAVQEGHQIIPIINRLLKMNFHQKIATKDWHPRDHGSFADSHRDKKPGDRIDLFGISQILWPVHCVQNTQGSEFVPGLDTDQFEHIFQKGKDKKVDSYSVFFDNGKRIATGLHDFLKGQGITDVYFAGLATDYCVKYSVLDALELGYTAHVIVDACRGVNLAPQDSEAALQEMQNAGARLVNSKDVRVDIPRNA